MDLHRQRSGQFSLGILRVDPLRIEQIGGAEEVPDTPIGGLLARADEESGYGNRIREGFPQFVIPVVRKGIFHTAFEEDSQILVGPRVHVQVEPQSHLGRKVCRNVVAPGIRFARTFHVHEEAPTELHRLRFQEGGRRVSRVVVGLRHEAFTAEQLIVGQLVAHRVLGRYPSHRHRGEKRNREKRRNESARACWFCHVSPLPVDPLDVGLGEDRIGQRGD